MPADAAASSPSVNDLQRRIKALEAEVWANSTDREEMRAREAALAEVLRAINTATGDFAPVFNLILEKAVTLCDAPGGGLVTIANDHATALAFRNTPQALVDYWSTPQYIGPASSMAQALRQGRTLHLPDMANSEPYRKRLPMPVTGVELGGIRSAIMVPLLNECGVIGLFVIYRREVRPFTHRQIAVVEAFAAQALLAMLNARLLAEQREALEQQTATAEVLQIISSSPGELQPVFDAILEKAHSLCDAPCGSLQLYDGETFRAVADRGLPEELATLLRQGQVPRQFNPSHHEVTHIVEAYDELLGDPVMRSAVQAAGLRTMLFVPLVSEGIYLGRIVAARREVRAFTNKQIALLQNFAAQAVIAMENARLLSELRQRTDDLTESLEYQTATSELLEVISRSTSDIQPVLDTMLAAAARLCGTHFGTIAIRQGDAFCRLAILGYAPEVEQVLRSHQFSPGRGSVSARVLLEKQVIQVADLATDPEFDMPELVRFDDLRTTLGVPLLRDGEAIGVIAVTHNRVEPFTERQIALVKTFADQAVIAMENARLLSELTRREQELSVTFDHMGDGVLMLDAQLRLAAWNRNFQRLLDIPDAFLATRPILDDYIRLLVERGEVGEGNVQAEIARYRSRASTPWSTERTRADGRVIEVRSNPIPGGGSVVIYSNITERKKAEADIAAARDAAEAALERQTATADILKVIAGSPTDVQPVLDAVAQAAVRFCGAADALINLRDGDEVFVAAHEGPLPTTLHRRHPFDRSFGAGRAMSDGKTIHIPDVSEIDPEEFSTTLALSREHGYKASIAAPLMREGVGIGAIVLRKREAGEFTQQQIELLEAFAAQGAIAIENVRLFTELREALEQQTATGEILRAISQSPTDVQPVLDAVVKAAVRFCGARDAVVALRDGEEYEPVAHYGPMRATIGERAPLNRQSTTGRAILDGATSHLVNIPSLDAVEFAAAQKLAADYGFRTALAAPMLRDGGAIGVVALRKSEATPFTPRQVELLESFAAQAVIAIENVRLFTELREALEQQTATADILRVISQSPTDVSPVLTAVAKAALKFCDARDAIVVLREGDHWSTAAHEGPIDTIVSNRRLTRGTAPGRAIVDGKVVQIEDYQSINEDEFLEGRELAARLGFRSALSAPLLRDEVAIGAITLRRPEPGSFTPNQIELLKSFAAQAVIAIENVRLFTELRDSLERLKAAQANLIQSEKMASLGQLTAGIAHEIKNPLNFVNNFAGLSGELLGELKQAVEALLAAPDDDKRAELQETMELLNSNLAKILEHGRRADGIVKSMLAHSRGGTGDWQSSNINGLVEEALNLAYHGARAQDQDFNVMLERDFSEALQPIDVVPQDMTRVFLNLFGNGFYATRKRQDSEANSTYRPTLSVSTRDLGEAVEIRVRDNGTGIEPAVQAKLFQPFFTTKPTGEGTGLGLSISYDIVTQQHGGTIEAASEPGQFTEFTVRLPRVRRTVAGSHP